MEVRSEQGVMSPREAFGVGLQKTLVTAQSPPPKMPNVQLTYTSDGTEVYKPVPGVSSPPYQGVAGSGLAAAAATVGASDGGDGHLTVIPQHGLNFSTGELPLKRKRGRPRKYGPEGTIALARTHLNSAVGGTPPPPAPFSLTSPSGLALTSPMRKVKGRPLGSGRKQQMDALGSGGIGFTPHVITVKAGEDVSAKIMSFCQHGPRAICILSANGAISNVTLRQTATSGGTVTYEGRFEILSITGSYMLSDNGGQNNRTGGLSVSLAGPDGRVLGGGVAGLLTAASPVQVVVGSFIADGRKDSKPAMKPSDHSSAPSKLASDGTTGPASPPSRGTPSESSDGPGSPLNPSTGAYNNSNQQGIYSNSNRQGTYNSSNQQGMSNIMWK